MAREKSTTTTLTDWAKFGKAYGCLYREGMSVEEVNDAVAKAQTAMVSGTNKTVANGIPAIADLLKSVGVI